MGQLQNARSVHGLATRCMECACGNYRVHGVCMGQQQGTRWAHKAPAERRGCPWEYLCGTQGVHGKVLECMECARGHT